MTMLQLVLIVIAAVALWTAGFVCGGINGRKARSAAEAWRTKADVVERKLERLWFELGEDLREALRKRGVRP